MSGAQVNCSTGCKTGPHATYGECLRAKSLRIAYCQSAANKDYTAQKKWDQELALYRSAKADGIQPDSTQTRDIRRAVEWSDRNQVGYSEEKKLEVDKHKAFERLAA